METFDTLQWCDEVIFEVLILYSLPHLIAFQGKVLSIFRFRVLLLSNLCTFALLSQYNPSKLQFLF